MTNKPQWLEKLHSTLEPFQHSVRNFIITHPYCAIYLNMGGGKTLTTLTALADIAPQGHILVIAPRMIALNTWPDEIEKWNIPLRVRSLISKKNSKGKTVKLNKKERYARYDEVLTDPPTFYLINKELVVDLVEYFATKGLKNKTPNYAHWPFATVIIDESQGFKSPHGKRFKAMARVRPYISRLIELTGTPAANSIADIWSQTYLLDMGQALFPQFTQFRATYYYPTKLINGKPVDWEEQPFARDHIFAAISHMALSATNDSIVLPDIHYVEHTITLDEDEYEDYQDFKEDAVLLYRTNEDKEHSRLDQHGNIVENYITADNAAALRTKLLQYAAGTIYVPFDAPFDIDEEDLLYTDTAASRYVLNVHDHKLDVLLDLIDSCDSPVIVAYRYKSDLYKISQVLEAKGIEHAAFDGDGDMLRAWNRGDIPVLLLQPASAAHGLNFQYGGHHIIWYSLPDNLEHYLQTNARLHRIGQKHDVTIHHIVIDETIDTTLLPLLKRKELTQQNLLDAMRAEYKH